MKKQILKKGIPFGKLSITKIRNRYKAKLKRKKAIKR